jgi:hypothetical protein
MSDVWTHREHDSHLGISTSVHSTETGLQIVKTWDAEPFLEAAKDARAMTDGDRWGEMRHVGFIPMAVLGTFMRQDGGFDKSRCIQWLKENPAMCTFSKALK